MSDARARVFISCGQARETQEAQVAHAIAEKLRARGFEPYVAVEEQTLRGLKENLFRQIENSEYFVFVDFKREELDSTGFHRGSLFSHQELAIAANREVELIAFREAGVKLEGISQFVQANAQEFTDRQHLPAFIAQTVLERNWDASWRNELTITADEPTVSETMRVDGKGFGFPAQFVHVVVRNRHKSKPAVNCYAYLEVVTNLRTEEDLPVPTIEHKWAGYLYPNAIIAPRSVRPFDAFWYPLVPAVRARSLLEFNVFADSTGYLPEIREPGTYRLAYRVICENFPAVAGNFQLTLTTDPLHADLRRCP
jgi:hypothetical protein